MTEASEPFGAQGSTAERTLQVLRRAIKAVCPANTQTARERRVLAEQQGAYLQGVLAEQRPHQSQGLQGGAVVVAERVAQHQRLAPANPLKTQRATAERTLQLLCGAVVAQRIAETRTARERVAPVKGQDVYLQTVLAAQRLHESPGVQEEAIVVAERLAQHQ